MHACIKHSCVQILGFTFQQIFSVDLIGTQVSLVADRSDIAALEEIINRSIFKLLKKFTTGIVKNFTPMLDFLFFSCHVLNL